MVTIVSRSDWGARAPRNRTSTTWSARTEFIVHYSEGPTSQTPRQIQDFHMDGNGWSDIGYNFLVDSDGVIYEGRGWLVVGAHATGHNTSGIGVCFIGRDGDATQAAKNAIRQMYDEAARLGGRGLSRLGHRDVNSTDCPGDDLYAWVRAGMPGDGGDPGAPPWPGVLLRYPPVTRHSSVLTWQRRMIELGWRIAADGAYGPESKRACMEFQTRERLDADGVVGPLTWRRAWEVEPG